VVTKRRLFGPIPDEGLQKEDNTGKRPRLDARNGNDQPTEKERHIRTSFHPNSVPNVEEKPEFTDEQATSPVVPQNQQENDNSQNQIERSQAEIWQDHMKLHEQYV
jgi:hypothetical protein